MDAPDLMKVTSLSDKFGELENASSLEEISKVELEIKDHLEYELESRKRLKLDKETIECLASEKKSELIEVN